MTTDNDESGDDVPSIPVLAEDIRFEASEALESLGQGPAAGEVEDAIGRMEASINEAYRQLEAAEDALGVLTGGSYGESVADTYDGTREARRSVEAVRQMAKEVEEQATDDDGEASGTLTVDGQEFEVSLSPADGDADTDDDDDEPDNISEVFG